MKRGRPMRKVSRRRLEALGGKLPASTLAAHGSGQREVTRRLAGVGLGRWDDADTRRAALREVAAYLDWVRQQPCLVLGRTSGEYARYDLGGVVFAERVLVEAAHVRTRGSRGADFGNVVPLHRRIHAWQGYHTEREFTARFGVSLRRAAAAYWARYEREVLGVSV